jgi:phosphoserine phosphatase RsbU/P
MPAPQVPKAAFGRILVADDQPHIVAALEMLLGGLGYQVCSRPNPAGVMEAVPAQNFDLLLIDLNYTRDTTGGSEGLDLVSQIRALDPTTPVVVMTAWSTVNLAVEAMRRGASDFIQKPWDNAELLEKVREQVELGRLRRRVQRREKEESAEAAEVQRSLLPGALPRVCGYEVSAVTRPKHAIGGDYYTVERISDSRFAICIADVAGKGLPGALLMSNLQASLKPLITQDLAPGALCRRLNRAFCEIMPANKFISFFYGVLDIRANRLTYCNAGHNPPLLLRADGSAHDLESSGAILGQFPQWTYSQAEAALHPGDTLLLFTDGLVEACDEEGDPYGEQRLLRAARQRPADDATALARSLWKAASTHCQDTFHDDVTLLVLRRKD